jgi:putative ABC transport system permease protein
VTQAVRVELPDSSDPVTGLLVGASVAQPLSLNRVVLRQGNWPAATASASNERIGAVVSAGFAMARGLKPGDTLAVVLDGRRRSLRIDGIGVSPDTVFAGMGGAPDPRGFGVFWVDPDLLAAATGLRGAFNRLAIRLAPGAREGDVIAAVSAALAPYGLQDAHGREHQTSHAMLDNEIQEQRVLGRVLPVIFLAVAAFLLNVVVARLVATQREQIAALKALGYTNREIGGHYLGLVGVVLAVGVVIGWAAGALLGAGLTGLYAEFFHFPRFNYRLDPVLALTAAGAAVATGLLGALQAVAGSVRLAPAEAMRPPAPGRYRRTVLERLGWRRGSPALRMILRQVERRALRTALSVAGVASAVAIVVLGNFFSDAIDHIVHTQFDVALRADVLVGTAEAVAASNRLALQRLPGVLEVEPQRNVAVQLQHGPQVERVQLQGLPRDGALRRVIDGDGRVHPLPADGLLMTARLASKLGLQPGDGVDVQVIEGRRPRLHVTLAATVDETMGLNVYIDRERLNRLLQEGDLANQFSLAVERGREGLLLDALREVPRVGGAFSKATLWRNMQEVSARNVRIMSTLLTAFAAVIAVGVVYNIARIALAERGWELASLRVLGFTRAEVSALLLGELALVLAVALPLGMVAGWALVHLLVGLLQSDQFSFPVVIGPSTYALAALAVLLAGAASAAVVRRRIDRLDLVGVLKTRE